MSRPARWECLSCRRLLGDIDQGRLRLARSVETVYVVPGGVAVACPQCTQPRVWYDDQPSPTTSTAGT